MNKLDELIEKFRNDKSWNTENKDGSHRFDKEIAWIEEMIKEYADFFKLPVNDVIEKNGNRAHLFMAELLSTS